MKQLFLFVTILFGIIACKQSPYGQGGKNAIQFLKEQATASAEDIESIEVTGEDSLLCDRALTLNEVALAKAGADYAAGNINKDNYQAIIDKFSQIATDISFSWQYSIAVNDSLRKLDKYDSDWRKVYEVTTTMKSGTTVTTRILMDSDGMTPRMTEKQFAEELNEWTDKLVKAQQDLFQ